MRYLLLVPYLVVAVALVGVIVVTEILFMMLVEPEDTDVDRREP